METESELAKGAAELQTLCSHISVRKDENGPFILALGLKGIHTLELRRIGSDYVVELWHGDADSEDIAAEPRFESAGAAFSAAREWLQRDAV